MWDVGEAREVAMLEHGGPVNMCAWSPDGARLASASSDKSVRLWDVSPARGSNGNTHIRVGLNLKGHTGNVQTSG